MIETIALICIFILPSIGVLIKKVFWDVYFWQIKEFRWDRFWTHVRWDQEEINRDYLSIGLKFIIFAGLTFIIIAPPIALASMLVLLILWTYETFQFLTKLQLGSIKRPALKNIRNILILALYAGLYIALIAIISIPFLALERDAGVTSTLQIYITDTIQNAQSSEFILPDIYILLAFISFITLFYDLATPFIVPFFVAITAPLSWTRRYHMIRQGKKVFDTHKNHIQTIGITGSQGKTTAKEYLAALLSRKYTVEKTPENFNTQFGVARAIKHFIRNKTEVFIAEIGAYRKGEIKRVVSRFPNNIAIITDIDTQHMGLFGSQEDLMKAKAEIISSETGTAILNGDNVFCRKVALNSPADTTILVTTNPQSKKEVETLVSSRIQHAPVHIGKKKNNRIPIEIQYQGVDLHFNIPATKYTHLIQIIALAIIAALETGLNKNEIQSFLTDVDFQPPRLSIESGDNQTTILDDTYSSSRKGFIAAVEVMDKIHQDQQRKGKRIVITSGILELGKEKKRIYTDLITTIGQSIDVLITTDFKLYNITKKANLGINTQRVRSIKEMIYEIRKVIAENDIILLEGRLNPQILKTIVSDTA